MSKLLQPGMCCKIQNIPDCNNWTRDNICRIFSRSMFMDNANVQFIYLDCFIKSVNVLHAYIAAVILMKPHWRPGLLAF